MAKKKILFVCTANSARSQMAEGFTRYYGGNKVDVDSAGTAPAGINPYAKWAMNEAGIDISHQSSDALESKQLGNFDYVVTLCGDARQSCPVLPGHMKSLHWPIPDPASVRGKPADIVKSFRIVRHHIERHVLEFLKQMLNGS